jgi:CheY-like chemotaxis protein
VSTSPSCCDLCSKPIRPEAATALRDGKLAHLVCLSRSTQRDGMDALERARLTVERARTLHDRARRAVEEGSRLRRPVSGSTVTVVDDDPAVSQALSRVLRAAGFTVTTFSSAEEFLSRSAGELPACLVLDHHLGGMSGVELSEALLEAGLAVPTVFVTAHDPADVGIHPGGVGAPVLSKPVDDDLLIETVRRAIDSRGPR